MAKRYVIVNTANGVHTMHSWSDGGKFAGRYGVYMHPLPDEDDTHEIWLSEHGRIHLLTKEFEFVTTEEYDAALVIDG